MPQTESQGSSHPTTASPKENPDYANSSVTLQIEDPGADSIHACDLHPTEGTENRPDIEAMREPLGLEEWERQFYPPGRYSTAEIRADYHSKMAAIESVRAAVAQSRPDYKAAYDGGHRAWNAFIQGLSPRGQLDLQVAFLQETDRQTESPRPVVARSAGREDGYRRNGEEERDTNDDGDSHRGKRNKSRS